jgi:hypothetical protein
LASIECWHRVGSHQPSIHQLVEGDGPLPKERTEIVADRWSREAVLRSQRLEVERTLAFGQSLRDFLATSGSGFLRGHRDDPRLKIYWSQPLRLIAQGCGVIRGEIPLLGACRKKTQVMEITSVTILVTLNDFVLLRHFGVFSPTGS